jgi:hypothetical protein
MSQIIKDTDIIIAYHKVETIRLKNNRYTNFYKY